MALAEIRQLTIEAAQAPRSEYIRIFTDASSKRWMGSVPRPGKRRAPICSPTLMRSPVPAPQPAATNMTASRLCPRMGHAMTRCSPAAQPYDLRIIRPSRGSRQHARALLIEHRCWRAGPVQAGKVFYLGQIMDKYRGNVFRQSMFAEFQLAINDLATKVRACRAKMSAIYSSQALSRPEGEHRASLCRRVGVDPALLLRLLRLADADFDHRGELLRAEVMHGRPADRDRYLDASRGRV